MSSPDQVRGRTRAISDPWLGLERGHGLALPLPLPLLLPLPLPLTPTPTLTYQSEVSEISRLSAESYRSAVEAPVKP